MGDLNNSLKLLQKLKKLCEIYKNSEILLKTLKKIASIYKEIQDFQESKRYLFEYLKQTWISDNHEHELKAYDYLGMIYYYLGDLELAKKLHDRMTQGTTETSEFKKKLVERIAKQDRLKDELH